MSKFRKYVLARVFFAVSSMNKKFSHGFLYISTQILKMMIYIIIKRTPRLYKWNSGFRRACSYKKEATSMRFFQIV